MFDAEAQTPDFQNESRALNAGTLLILLDSAYHIPPVLKSFRLRYPSTIVLLKVGNSEAAIQGLHSYKADTGLLGEQPNTA